MRTLPVFLLLALANPVGAVPLELPAQGRLLDSAGAPLDGAHELAFAIYDAPAGGTPVWSDTFGVEVDSGFYAVALGSGAALDAALFGEAALFLGISVDGGAELPTRQPLLSVPFAIRAGDADRARDLSGGVVDATEIRVNGLQVIDPDGRVADTLAGLSCDTGSVAEYDGAGWVCAPNLPPHEHDATELTAGTLDVARLPIGTGSAEVAAGDHGHALSTLAGPLTADQLPSDLASGTTVGGAAIVTGKAYSDSDAIAAVGPHYTDSQAIAAVGPHVEQSDVLTWLSASDVKVKSLDVTAAFDADSLGGVTVAQIRCEGRLGKWVSGKCEEFAVVGGASLTWDAGRKSCSDMGRHMCTHPELFGGGIQSYFAQLRAGLESRSNGYVWGAGYNADASPSGTGNQMWYPWGYTSNFSCNSSSAVMWGFYGGPGNGANGCYAKSYTGALTLCCPNNPR